MIRVVEVDRPQPALSGEDNAAYRRKLDEMVAGIGRLDRQAQGDTLELLAALRAQVVETIGSSDLGTANMYQRTLGSIDEAIRRFVERYRTDVAAVQALGFAQGVALTEAPLVAGGIAVGASALTDELVDTLTTFSADLIQGIGTELRKRINAELVGVLVGAQTPHDAVTKIGRRLTDPSHFRTIGARAQAITVTEIGRAASVGAQARQTELAAILPGLHKRWLHAHVGQARPAHLALESRHGLAGPVGPIPVDGLYSVNGHPARFPKDPSLPARETVHCRCQSIPVVLEIPPAETAA